MRLLRLNMYNKYIINFDSIDRKLNFNKTELKNIKLNSKKYIASTKSLFLILEIITHQYFSTKSLNNKNSRNKTNTIKIFLKKKNWPSLLDIYINSIYLCKKQELNISYSEMINKSYVFLTSQTIENLKLTKQNKNRIQFNIKNQTIYNLILTT